MPAVSASTIRHSANATISSLSIASTGIARRALSLPHAYSKYVAANATSVGQIEGALRSLTYLLPGVRLHDSELASESLHSFIQLLSIYHDRLLKERSSLVDSSPTLSKSTLSIRSKPKLSPHARYTTFWSNTSTLYSQVATFLKIAQYTELLWEMLARRRGGERTRWRVVVLLESFKALCRLILLRLTNSRPLVNPPMPLREDFAPPEPEPETVDEFSEEELDPGVERDDPYNLVAAFGQAGVLTPPHSESEKTIYSTSPSTASFSMPRTGMTLPTLPTPDEISNYLLAHVITSDDVKPAKQLLHRLTSMQGQIAEVLHILRPVIYALLMQRMARRYGYEGNKWRKNWAPWLIGLSIEYFSRQMAKRDLTTRVPGGVRRGLSTLEQDELKKRDWGMAWWAMRGAFYENVTKKWVTGFADKLKGKPLLDLVGGVVEDYDYLWSNYHFSSATM